MAGLVSAGRGWGCSTRESKPRSFHRPPTSRESWRSHLSCWSPLSSCWSLATSPCCTALTSGKAMLRPKKDQNIRCTMTTIDGNGTNVTCGLVWICTSQITHWSVERVRQENCYKRLQISEDEIWRKKGKQQAEQHMPYTRLQTVVFHSCPSNVLKWPPRTSPHDFAGWGRYLPGYSSPPGGKPIKHFWPLKVRS